MGGRRQGVMGFIRPALLFLLAQNESHGYSLLDSLAQFDFNPSGVDPSLIYRTLREMEEFGWVTSQLGEESLGPQRRIYSILPEGETVLAEMIHSLRRRRDEIDQLLQAYDTGMKTLRPLNSIPVKANPTELCSVKERNYKMKIAISSPDGKIDSPFSPQFECCQYFIFVDTDTREWTAQANLAAAESGERELKWCSFWLPKKLRPPLPDTTAQWLLPLCRKPASKVLKQQKTHQKN